jgi:hypothetical protein
VDRLGHDWLVVTGDGLTLPELELVTPLEPSELVVPLEPSEPVVPLEPVTAGDEEALPEDVVPALLVDATCLVEAESAGSFPSTSCTKITSHAAMNAASEKAITRRLMLRARSRRPRSRARASALPDI